MPTDEQPALPAVMPLSERHPDIPLVLTRFQLAIDAYREMLEKVLSDIHELDQRRLGANELAAIKTIPEENRARLAALLARLEDPETPGVAATSEEEAKAQEREIQEIFRSDRFAAASFLSGMREAMAGPSRAAIVHNSLLVMAISAFEVLLSGLISRQFVAFPDALQVDQKEFSLEDVRGFQTEEDAIDLLLARRVTRSCTAAWMTGASGLMNAAMRRSLTLRSIGRRYVRRFSGAT
jgi:hypothetical protein